MKKFFTTLAASVILSLSLVACGTVDTTAYEKAMGDATAVITEINSAVQNGEVELDPDTAQKYQDVAAEFQQLAQDITSDPEKYTEQGALDEVTAKVEGYVEQFNEIKADLGIQ